MKIRLDKVLSHVGLGSRKEVLEIIRKKLIKVNGQTITDPSIKIDPLNDLIFYGDKPLTYQKYYYYKLYKPSGILTSTKDLEKTVLDLLPESLPGRKEIFPAGRLDKDAEGLIILTNDGELAHRLTHPKWKTPKIYEIEINLPLQEKDKLQIEGGIFLKEGKTKPAQIEILNPHKTHLKISVIEGRHHLLKRLFKRFGYRVLKIKRIAIGPITLEGLSVGEWKRLTSEEISQLKKALNLG